MRIVVIVPDASGTDPQAADEIAKLKAAPGKLTADGWEEERFGGGERAFSHPDVKTADEAKGRLSRAGLDAGLLDVEEYPDDRWGEECAG
jgi:hypothetical protein